jgi:hypothetical protein
MYVSCAELAKGKCGRIRALGGGFRACYNTAERGGSIDKQGELGGYMQASIQIVILDMLRISIQSSLITDLS